MKRFQYLILFIILILSNIVIGQTSITINSSSSSIIDADILVLEISIINNGTVLDSLNVNQYDNIHKILDVLKKYNYQPKDISLVESNIGNESNLFISSFEDNTTDEVPKYHAQQTYRLCISDFSIYEDLKKDLIVNGAKLIRIMNFGTTKYEEVKKLTYLKALNDAKKKVETLYTLPYKEIRIKQIYDNTNDWEADDLEKELTFKVETNSVKAEKRLLTTITNAKVEISVTLRVDFEIIP